MIALKRVYEKAEKDDGYRVLVDRLWPRGVSKVEAHTDLWLKEIGPSNQLRQWFGHDPEKWDEFRKKYQKELDSNSATSELKDVIKKEKKVTLLYGAKDELHNQAVVLKEWLLG